MESGYDIRSVQAFPGYSDLTAEKTYARLVGRNKSGIISPSDYNVSHAYKIWKKHAAV